MKLRISHSSIYSYNTPVEYALQQVRLTPFNNSQQTVLDWSIEIEGGKEELVFDDQYGNQTLTVSINPGHEEIRVTASGTVETHDGSGILGFVHGRVPLWYFKHFSERTKPGKQIRLLAKLIDHQNMLESLHFLSREILSALPYGKGQTFVDTPAEDALSLGNGVCQDHA